MLEAFLRGGSAANKPVASAGVECASWPVSAALAQVIKELLDATPEFRDLVIARLPIYKYQAGRLAFVCVCVLAFDALMALYQKMRQLVKLWH